MLAIIAFLSDVVYFVKAFFENLMSGELFAE